MARTRHEARKFAERALHGVKVLEIVQMVGLNVVHDGDGGVEIQERVAVFAALHDNGVAGADAVACVQQREIAAHHNGRVALCLHENMRQHAGRGGLAVCAGHADGVFVFAHDHTPGLRPLEHGDALRAGRGDLGSVGVGGGRADDAVRALNILGAVADVHFDALGDQLVGGDGGVHVRAGDRDAHAAQHQPERPHGDASDADQVNVLTGDKVAVQTFEIVCHIPSSCFRRSVRARRAGSELVRQRRVMTPLAFAELCGAAIRSVVRLKLSYCERAMQMNARDIRERRAILQKT